MNYKRQKIALNYKIEIALKFKENVITFLVHYKKCAFTILCGETNISFWSIS